MSGVQESSQHATHTAEQQPEYSSKDFHTAFGFILGLLLTLAGVKYQGSGTTLFQENRRVVPLFIMAISLYATALVKMALLTRNDRDQIRYQTSNSYPAVFLIAGTFASELLLFILLTPFTWSLLNILALVFLMVQQYGCRLRILNIGQTGTDRTISELVPNSGRDMFTTICNMSTSIPTTTGDTTDQYV